MSVRGSKQGKTSHHQKPVAAAGGQLFLKAVKGNITPVRGAAGGLLFLKARKKPKAKRLARPSFEHSARRGYR